MQYHEMWKNFSTGDEHNATSLLLIFFFNHLEHKYKRDKFYRSTINESSTIALFKFCTIFVKRKDGIPLQHFRTYFLPCVIQRKKKKKRGWNIECLRYLWHFHPFVIARRRWIQPIPESPRGSGTTGCLAIYAKWYVAPSGASQPGRPSI